MPLYEYHCHDCGKDHEIIQKFSDPILKKCPDCGGKIERLISQSSFVLKGGGWYKDGYSGKSSSTSTDTGTTKTENKTKTETSSSTTDAPKTCPTSGKPCGCSN